MARYSPTGWMLRLAVEHGANFSDRSRTATTKAAVVEALRLTAELGHEWSAREDRHLRLTERFGDEFWVITDVDFPARRYHFEALRKVELRRLRERETLEQASAPTGKSHRAPGDTVAPARRMRL